MWGSNRTALAQSSNFGMYCTTWFTALAQREEVQAQESLVVLYISIHITSMLCIDICIYSGMVCVYIYIYNGIYIYIYNMGSIL